MSTEIIKLNSFKSNLQGLFSGLLAKFQSPKNYDITLVIQENLQDTTPRNSIDSQNALRNSKPSVNFNDNALILNDAPSESAISMSDCISEPNFLSEKNIAEPLDKQPIKVKRTPASFNKQNQQQIRLKHQTINNYTQTEPPSRDSDCKAMRTQLKIQHSIQVEDKQYSMKVNDLELESANTSEEGDEDADSNAGFLIEKHLNLALNLVEQNKINDLQDFLYHYKEKYSFINIRTQTKWSLLMAHCKEAKMEYERAATNYSQAIANLQQHPCMMMDLGEIYGKLGRCYHEIKMWNKGIQAYTEALKHFKSNKRVTEYCNVMISLGVLYLEVNYFVEAEKCFLVAYQIKRHEGEQTNRANLLPVLLHLLECNFNLKNYQQSEQLLGLIHEIIQESQHLDSALVVAYQVKQAKLSFFKGQLQNTYNCCQEALSLLSQNKLQTKDYGQVLEMMGLLKQERGEYLKSKDYFQRALKSIQKYFPNDSQKIKILKSRIETVMMYAGKNNNRERQRKVSIQQKEDEESSIPSSECLQANFYEL